MLFAADFVGDKQYDDYLRHHGGVENRALTWKDGLRYGATRETLFIFHYVFIQ